MSKEILYSPTEGISYIDCSKCKFFTYEEYNCGDGDYLEFEACERGHELYPEKCIDVL